MHGPLEYVLIQFDDDRFLRESSPMRSSIGSGAGIRNHGGTLNLINSTGNTFAGFAKIEGL